ncbi:hypothetical protein C8R47DRAFT_1073598 [Mycena vitilis]|nr:hypothetical protein C8R47DRAFT_1073598 [Mycena vitilis]
MIDLKASPAKPPAHSRLPAWNAAFRGGTPNRPALCAPDEVSLEQTRPTLCFPSQVLDTLPTPSVESSDWIWDTKSARLVHWDLSPHFQARITNTATYEQCGRATDIEVPIRALNGAPDPRMHCASASGEESPARLEASPSGPVFLTQIFSASVAPLKKNWDKYPNRGSLDDRLKSPLTRLAMPARLMAKRQSVGPGSHNNLLALITGDTCGEVHRVWEDGAHHSSSTSRAGGGRSAREATERESFGDGRAARGSVATEIRPLTRRQRLLPTVIPSREMLARYALLSRTETPIRYSNSQGINLGAAAGVIDDAEDAAPVARDGLPQARLKYLRAARRAPVISLRGFRGQPLSDSSKQFRPQCPQSGSKFSPVVKLTFGCGSLIALLGITPAHLYENRRAPLPFFDHLEELDEPLEEFDDAESDVCEAEEPRRCGGGSGSPVRGAKTARALTTRSWTYTTIALAFRRSHASGPGFPVDRRRPRNEILGDEYLTIQEAMASIASITLLPSKSLGHGAQTLTCSTSRPSFVAPTTLDTASSKYRQIPEGIHAMQNPSKIPLAAQASDVLQVLIFAPRQYNTPPPSSAKAATRRTKLYKEVELEARDILAVINAGGNALQATDHRGLRLSIAKVAGRTGSTRQSLSITTSVRTNSLESRPSPLLRSAMRDPHSAAAPRMLLDFVVRRVYGDRYTAIFARSALSPKVGVVVFSLRQNSLAQGDVKLRRQVDEVQGRKILHNMLTRLATRQRRLACRGARRPRCLEIPTLPLASSDLHPLFRRANGPADRDDSSDDGAAEDQPLDEDRLQQEEEELADEDEDSEYPDDVPPLSLNIPTFLHSKGLPIGRLDLVAQRDRHCAGTHVHSEKDRDQQTDVRYLGGNFSLNHAAHQLKEQIQQSEGLRTETHFQKGRYKRWTLSGPPKRLLGDARRLYLGKVLGIYRYGSVSGNHESYTEAETVKDLSYISLEVYEQVPIDIGDVYDNDSEDYEEESNEAGKKRRPKPLRGATKRQRVVAPAPPNLTAEEEKSRISGNGCPQDDGEETPGCREGEGRRKSEKIGVGTMSAVK